MFPKVVDQADKLALMGDAVYRDMHLALMVRRLPNGDVVNRFLETVVDFEACPLQGKTWRKVKLVNFQSQSQ